MILSGRRLILIGAIAGIALAIILLPLIVTISSPTLDQVTIELVKVQPGEQSLDGQKLPMQVVFRLTNPTEQTLTTSKIDYDLFANDDTVGSFTLSYEDIPPNGRPGLYSNQPINLTSSIQLIKSNSNEFIYDRISSGPDDINWSVDGVAQIEAALTLIEKPFSDEM